MKSRVNMLLSTRTLSRLITLLALTCAFAAQTTAQTPGGTAIQNQASASYSDGSGNNFNTVSNTVTVTVANVSGLTITPDAGTRPSVVAGETNVRFTFRVTNTGNFADQVRFLAGGASVQLTGPATVTAAAIDVNGNGLIDAGDTNIWTNGADVLSASLAQNGFIDVVVAATVNASAASGSTVTVVLGDAATGAPTYDNQALVVQAPAHDVSTVSSASVNGIREARGDISATVDNDVQLQLALTAPAGPVALGSDITYTWQVCNPGARATAPITLANAPAGSNSGVFIIAPIPAGTVLKSGQTFPAGTLYTTSPLATDPLTATWTTTAPAPLSNLTRIAFNVNSLAVGACSSSISMLVTVTTSDATSPILEIGDAFARNTVSANITDQSGDTVSNAGDGNANFNEGSQPGNTDGNGVIQQTLLQAVGAILVGPLGQPGAVGPTNNNDDYTNHSVTTGIAGIPPGGTTTAAGTVIFSNTVQNTGNSNDTFVLSAPTVPAGFTVEISTNSGASYVTVQPGNGSVTLPLAFGASANILVRVTAPAGLQVLTGFDTVIRAASTNTPASTNNTINRLYTGFIRLDKATTISNTTGVGGPTDVVPGAQITYAITYTNVSSSGGSNNSTLTASNIVITENGNAAPNNWGSTTDHVVGATDTRGGTITGDAAGSVLLTDTVPGLGPGQSGVFTFRRRIK